MPNRAEAGGEHQPLTHEDALRAIVVGNLPCLTCHRFHVRRPTCNVPGHGYTWADPDDGHAQRPMTPAEFANAVLAGAQFGSSRGSDV